MFLNRKRIFARGDRGAWPWRPWHALARA